MRKSNKFSIKIKWVVVFLLSILLLSSLLFIYFKPFLIVKKSSPHSSLKEQHLSYFVTAPVAEFCELQLPCINVQIEDQNFLLLLDLGFRGAVSITTKELQKISHKSFFSKRPMYGISGKEYIKNVYKISEIDISRMSFVGPNLEEENEESRQESVIIHEGPNPSSRDCGKVGWELFQDTNLLLDLGNSKIAFSDGIDTLKEQGYDIEEFTQASLLLDRGLVEMEVLTTQGLMRCTLDTGATWNVLNMENREEKSFKELATDPQNVLEFALFQINGKNFGPLTFHKFPTKLPIHIDAILGMEFFRSHLVFIDFWNNVIYFSPLKEKHNT